MRLVAMSAGQTLSFPLRQGSTLIGRQASCHICIPSKAISRRHCQCYVDGTSVILRDLGSSHGTFVNGKRVERADLRHGDVVSLGTFELRFDSEGAAPSYGHGAGAAEDIVVAALAPGTGMSSGPAPDMQGAAQPFPQEPPPPAPTDFPEQPSGEETPADQSFVPAPYVPRQETVLGAADQPQLVVREGRWFLRDPRTGREVEIAPTGAGAAGAVAAPTAGLRRPNVRLLVSVIAGVAVLIAIVAVVISPGRRKPIDDPRTRMSDAAWAQVIDAGVDELKKGSYAEATAQFKVAYSKRSDLEPARLLTQYSLLRQAAGEDFTKLNRTEARRYLDSIENTRCPSEKALAFAREQRDWIEVESVALGLYDAAMQRLKQVGESEDGLIEVRGLLLQIPQNRYAAKLAKLAVADIDKTVADKRLDLARREMAQLKWAEAIPHLDAAIQCLQDAKKAAEAKKQIEECRRYTQEADAVRQAQQAISNKNYDGADDILKRIKPGYYYDRAQRLMADTKRMRAAEAQEAIRQQIKSLYESGAPPDVIEEAINKHKLEEFRHMAERAKRILALLAAGKKADDDKQYREAEDKYQEAVGVESDTNNDYHRRAQRLIEAIKARYPEIAAEFAEDGYRLINKAPAVARKHFEEALKYDANSKRAKDGLAQLERQAKLLYNEGSRHAAEKRFHNAKAVLEKARDSAPPGSELYQRIEMELQKILKQLHE